MRFTVPPGAGWARGDPLATPEGAPAARRRDGCLEAASTGAQFKIRKPTDGGHVVLTNLRASIGADPRSIETNTMRLGTVAVGEGKLHPVVPRGSISV